MEITNTVPHEMITTREGFITTGEMVRIVNAVAETTAIEVIVRIGMMTGNAMMVALEPDLRMTIRILSGGDKILLPLAAKLRVMKKARVFHYVRIMTKKTTVVNTMPNADVFQCSVTDTMSR